jgi:hypothetical protein
VFYEDETTELGTRAVMSPDQYFAQKFGIAKSSTKSKRKRYVLLVMIARVLSEIV